MDAPPENNDNVYIQMLRYNQSSTSNSCYIHRFRELKIEPVSPRLNIPSCTIKINFELVT